MKIIEFKKINKINEVSKDALFCFGLYNPVTWLMVDFKEVKNEKWPFNTIGNKMVKNLFNGGFYLIINSPFEFKSDYVSDIDFIKKNGIIKNRILFSLRKSYCTKGFKGKWLWTYMNVKFPLNDKCEISCIDPSGPQPEGV